MAEHRSARISWWRTAKLRALLSLGIVLGIGSVGTFAFWTDTVTVSGTTFTAGTLTLNVNGSRTPPAYTALNISTMVPGNTTAGTLLVKNAGTAPLKYSVSSTASNADTKGLGAALVAKVTGATAVAGTSPAATCAGTALAGTGTSFTSALISPNGRLLQPGASETICVQATLPAAASTTLQGATTNIVLAFTGTSDLS